MTYGSYKPILEDDEQVYAYFREYEGTKWLVLLNISEETAERDWSPFFSLKDAELLIGNYDDSERQELSPYEARIYQV